MAEEEFTCRAINDYFASVTDELDLKEGALYTIMQTSPSGWWYAVNEEGEDGWVPSNYLLRVDDEDGVTTVYDDGDDQETGDTQTVLDYTAEDDAKESVLETPSEPEPKVVVKTESSRPKPAPSTTSTTTKTTTTTTYSQPAAVKKSTISPFSSVADPAPDKPVTEWTVDETLAYLKEAATLDKRNDFKLTQACRFLTQLANKGHGEEICEKAGLDIVFQVLRSAADDVAILMSCCAAIVVLCANPASKQYPATVNGIYFISQAIGQSQKNRAFVTLACNAVCNFCHNHPQHRAMALETDVVDQIVAAMIYHRGKTEGYAVHSAGCLALRNIAADARGQGAVGAEGVAAIVAGLEEYRAMVQVVEGSLGVLCNLCALAANGEAFVMQGGLQLLDNIYSDPDSSVNSRLAGASVLHNLAANPDTAMLLSADQGIDVIIKILKLAEVDDPLFLNTLKVLAALLFKLPDDSKAGGNSKQDVMDTIIGRGLLASLNEAVQYDLKELQEICATLFIVIAQTAPRLAQALADADTPAHLIPMCLSQPTGQALHCSFALFFHVCDTFANHNSLVENGIFKLLASEWYRSELVKEDTLKIACGVYIKLLSNANHAAVISDHEAGILAFVGYIRERKPELADLCNAIENALKHLDPMAHSGGSIHVQETYSQVKQSGGSGAGKKAADDEAKEQSEVKQLKKASTVDQQPRKQSSTTVARATGKTMGRSAPTEAPDTGGKTYTWEELKSNKFMVPQDKKEAYLTDEDFEEVFGMDKPTFYSLKPWKQTQLKKKKGLF